MSYVKSVPLKKLFQYTQDDDEVVLLASENEQPEDADLFKDVVLNSLQGAAADPTRIGTEYMPEIIEVDYIALADDATAVIPDGALARVGNRLYMGDGVLDGGRRIGSKPLTIAVATMLDTSTCLKTGTGPLDRKFIEVGRIEMDPENLSAGKILSVLGKVKFSATTAPGAQRRFSLIPASLWDVYVTAPETTYATAIESAVNTSSGAFGFIPGAGSGDTSVTDLDVDVAMSALMTVNSGNFCYWVTQPKTVYGRGYNWLPTPGAITQVAPVGGGASINFDITIPDEMVLVFSLAASVTTVVDIDVDLRFSIR